MTPRPTGRPAVRPRRLGGPGPSSCRRGSAAAPRRPLSFLQVPHEAVTGFHRWDFPPVQAASTLAGPVVQSPVRLGAALVCREHTQVPSPRETTRSVSGKWGGRSRHGGLPTWVSVVGTPSKRSVNVARPGPSAGVREEPPSPGAILVGSGCLRLPQGISSLSGSWERSLDPRGETPDQATRRMAVWVDPRS